MIIIDRRLGSKNKNITNRKRFIEKAKGQIKDSLNKTFTKRSISDIDTGEKVKISKKIISEPTFKLNPKKGNRKYVLPGNKEYVPGDKVFKPRKEDKSGKEGSNNKTISEDDFEFVLTHREFMDILFENLELPKLVKKHVDITETETIRQGVTNVGVPANLNLEKTMIKSFGRRIALKFPKAKRIHELQSSLDEESEEEVREKINKELTLLTKRHSAIPYVDPVDLRYNNTIQIPKPRTNAVMICIMDVSASMCEREKEIAKRYFILLYSFLKIKYDRVKIIYIKHHTIATEVDEVAFFTDRESGGTVVSTGLKLALDIIKERFPVSQWNIYANQISDGDNYSRDNTRCLSYLEELLKIVQLYVYIEILDEHQDFEQQKLLSLYKEYIPDKTNLQIKYIQTLDEIYPTFRELFRKE